MRRFIIIILMTSAINGFAQTDSTKSVRDYILIKEKTDPNMDGVIKKTLKVNNVILPTDSTMKEKAAVKHRRNSKNKKK